MRVFAIAHTVAVLWRTVLILILLLVMVVMVAAAALVVVAVAVAVAVVEAVAVAIPLRKALLSAVVQTWVDFAKNARGHSSTSPVLQILATP